MNLQTGAFGDPTKTETLILFWGKMEELHYPGAGSTKKYLEDKMQQEQMQMQMAMVQQNLAMAGQGAGGAAAAGTQAQVSPAVGG